MQNEKSQGHGSIQIRYPSDPVPLQQNLLYCFQKVFRRIFRIESFSVRSIKTDAFLNSLSEGEDKGMKRDRIEVVGKEHEALKSFFHNLCGSH